MKRRECIAALAIAAGTLAGPRALLAQLPKRPRVIGVLLELKPDPLPLRYLEEFKSGMRELGYSEGRDYKMVLRWAEGDLNRLPVLANELIAAKADLIIPIGGQATRVARKLGGTLPIVIVTESDPVGSGLAASLSRPGGSVTGLTAMNADLAAKRLDLMSQIVPGLRRVGLVEGVGRAGGAAQAVQELQTALDRLKITAIPAVVRTAEDVAPAFETLKRGGAQALIVAAGSAIIAQRQAIIERAAAARLPAIYVQSAFAESGGLIAYAPRYEDLFRRAAGYADKIFKGVKPAELPIEQPTKFELVINHKTAKALGLTIPQDLLLRADKVIE